MTYSSQSDNDLTLIDPTVPHGSGVRLGTLVLIRWIGLCGQLLSIGAVYFILGFDVQAHLTVPTILISALLNLWFSLRVDTNTRLTDAQSAAHLTFDLVHLAALLFLTGGLSNPFSTLMLVPSSVSATILGRHSTKFLIFTSIGLVTCLAFTPFPLPWDGPPPELNPIILLGVWISLCFTLVFLALYMARVAREGRERARALSATRAALEQEQRMAELGTLAAAAAHELGTPLGTILLVSNELLKGWQGDDAGRTDLELIVDQTSRCRDILAELSAKKRAGDADHFTYLDIEAILREAAAPHEGRGPKVTYERKGDPQLIVRRTPEHIHAFRNLIENATGFARSSVKITTQSTSENLMVSVDDDGPGFDPQIIKRLGEPYVTTRQPTPGQDGGLGLGLFIAKTLLERTGAEVIFGTSVLGGACISMTWPREALSEKISEDDAAEAEYEELDP
ncbi:MAG: ActS/PrrB/RegB family redox-sensitive histidine kinase [Kordiimonas sp.]